MDAPAFNGDVDDREFGPSLHEDDCKDCGARWDADCERWCGCEDCLRRRADREQAGGETA